MMAPTPNELADEAVNGAIAEGYLKKKGDKGIAKLWRVRYFCLIGSLLHYAESPSSPVIGTVALDGETSIVYEEEGSGTTFHIKHETRPRIYYLQANSADEASSWVQTLTSVLKQLKPFIGVAAVNQTSVHAKEGRVRSGSLLILIPKGNELEVLNSPSQERQIKKPEKRNGSGPLSRKNRNWSVKKVWLVLHQNTLAYFEDQSETTLLGILVLEDCKVVVGQPPHVRHESHHPSSQQTLSPRKGSGSSLGEPRASAAAQVARREIELTYPLVDSRAHSDGQVHSSPRNSSLSYEKSLGNTGASTGGKESSLSNSNPEDASATGKEPKKRLHAMREARSYKGTHSPRRGRAVRVEEEGVSPRISSWFQIINMRNRNIFMEDVDHTFSSTAWLGANEAQECQQWAKSIRVAMSLHAQQMAEYEGDLLSSSHAHDRLTFESQSTMKSEDGISAESKDVEEKYSSSSSVNENGRRARKDSASDIASAAARKRSATQLVSGSSALASFDNLMSLEGVETASWLNLAIHAMVSRLKSQMDDFLVVIAKQMKEADLPSFIQSLSVDTLDFDDNAPRICGAVTSENSSGSSVLAAFRFAGQVTICVSVFLMPVKALKKIWKVQAKVVINCIQGVARLAFPKIASQEWSLSLTNPPHMDISINLFLGKNRGVDIALVPKVRSFLAVMVRSLFNRFLVAPSQMLFAIPVPLGNDPVTWRIVRQQKKNLVTLVESPEQVKDRKRQTAFSFVVYFLNRFHTSIASPSSTLKKISKDENLLMKSLFASHISVNGFSKEVLPRVVGLKRARAIFQVWVQSLDVPESHCLCVIDIAVGIRSIYIEWVVIKKSFVPDYVWLKDKNRQKEQASSPDVASSASPSSGSGNPTGNVVSIVDGIGLALEEAKILPLREGVFRIVVNKSVKICRVQLESQTALDAVDEVSSADQLLSPREQERKGLKGLIFGCQLKDIVSNKDLCTRGIPNILRDCCDYLHANDHLKTRGIFRIAGDHIKLRSFCTEINEGKEVVLPENNPHLVAAIFKRFIGDLPEPLCTFALYKEFLTTWEQASKLTETREQVKLMQKIISKLPKENRTVLMFTLQFLSQVIDNCEENKMPASNLSLVFSPLLFSSNEPPTLETIRETTQATQLVTFMITHVKKLD